LKTKLALTVAVLAIFFAATGQAASAQSQGKIPSWLYNAFMCIKSHEGWWTANTGNGYYGAFQMDRSFQMAYGRDYVRRYGWAHNWPPSVQLEVAVRGWRDRGFAPWPNTARMCGLL